MSRRIYIASRRAYWPRVWPTYAVAFAVAGPVAYLSSDGLLAGVLGTCAGTIATTVNLRVWKRRHPQISAEEYVQDLRDAARWN